MKRISSFFLSAIICLSLCACGSVGKGPNPTEEIVGEWLWDTGFVTWHFIFDADGTCHYWNGNKEIKYSNYTIGDDKHICIDNLDWDFYYEIDENTFALYYDRGKNRNVKFVKNQDYVPSDLIFVELDKDICKEIKAKIEEDVETDKDIFLLGVTLASRETGLTFTDISITKKQKEDPYTYIAYGVIYAEDNYGKRYKQNINIVYNAVKNEEEACGYELSWNLKFVD